MTMRLEWIPLKQTTEKTLGFGRAFFPFEVGEDKIELSVVFNVLKSSAGELFVSWPRRHKKDDTWEDLIVFGPSKECRKEVQAYIIEAFQSSNISIDRVNTAERPAHPSETVDVAETTVTKPKKRSAFWKATEMEKIG